MLITQLQKQRQRGNDLRFICERESGNEQLMMELVSSELGCHHPHILLGYWQEGPKDSEPDLFFFPLHMQLHILHIL